jgi:hypothetical protein
MLDINMLRIKNNRKGNFDLAVEWIRRPVKTDKESPAQNYGYLIDKGQWSSKSLLPERINRIGYEAKRKKKPSKDGQFHLMKVDETQCKIKDKKFLQIYLN